MSITHPNLNLFSLFHSEKYFLKIKREKYRRSERQIIIKRTNNIARFIEEKGKRKGDLLLPLSLSQYFWKFTSLRQSFIKGNHDYRYNEIMKQIKSKKRTKSEKKKKVQKYNVPLHWFF